MLENYPSTTRRDWLQNIGQGFGMLALSSMLARNPIHASEPSTSSIGGELPIRPDGGLHHAPRVRRVIQLFMNGGASPMDTFDYKPALEKYHGQSLGPKEKPEGFTAPAGAVMKSPFRFRQHGESGRWVSEVFPHQAKWVDHFAFIMSMASKTNVHGPGSYMMNTGFILPGFPCFGAWVSYALGNLTDNLPTFVVLPDSRGLPYNQRGNFSSGFLPVKHQGLVLNAAATDPIPNLQPSPTAAFAQRTADKDGLGLLQQFNTQFATQHQGDNQLTARLSAYELAAKMQLSAPEAFDLKDETAATLEAYGLHQKTTEDFGRRCLLARRLIERGVRFVQVWSGPSGAANNWDNHGSIIGELPPIATSVDQPISALLGDLFSRGLMDDTLVIWTTEFGRTPFAQSSVGRDHNGGSFVTWLCGAGVKEGFAYGASDELGYQAVEGKAYCYDLHATLLHLLGIDHKQLTFRHAGIDRRLTDVHGKVIQEILSNS
jgi:hypothetical protein